jgi:hypothetical protein
VIITRTLILITNLEQTQNANEINESRRSDTDVDSLVLPSPTLGERRHRCLSCEPASMGST